MAKILSHSRVYSFLHVPVQSGSDFVLGEMKREYCIDDFKHVVDFLRKRYRSCVILYAEIYLLIFISKLYYVKHDNRKCKFT